MKKLSKILAVTLASVMLLTGCGNSNAGSTTGTSSTGTGTETATEATLPKSIRIGTNPEFPPFEYINGKGEIDGFDMAVMKEVGKRLDIKTEFVNMEFKGLIGAMEAGNIDAIASGMTIKKGREVAFTDSYYEAIQYMILPKDSKYTKFEELSGLKIGVQEGTTGDFFASDDEGDSPIKNAKVTQFKKGADAVMALKNGAIDAIVIDANPAMRFVEKNTDSLKYVIDESAEKEHYGFAVAKGNDVLLNAINKTIQEMRDDGAFDKLVEEYIVNGK